MMHGTEERGNKHIVREMSHLLRALRSFLDPYNHQHAHRPSSINNIYIHASAIALAVHHTKAQCAMAHLPLVIGIRVCSERVHIPEHG